MGATPTPAHFTSSKFFGETPTPSQARAMGAESRWRVRTGREPAAEVEISEPYWKMDMVERNKPLTDEDLDAMLPSEGYEVRSFLFCTLILQEQILHFCYFVCFASYFFFR